MDTDRIYDDAALHYRGEWPSGLPVSQAYIHTGLYLGWLVGAGMCSGNFRNTYAVDIAAFINGDISGPALFEKCGGKLTSGMLTPQGNGFTASYFDLENGAYLDDYGNLLANTQPTAYHVADTPESARRIGERIQQRFKVWLEKDDA
jgi:hypothetical protein